MKSNILIHSIAALLAALPLAKAEDTKPEAKNEKSEKEAKHEKKNPSAPFVSADGTATITIDINGKKETRTFKLGDGRSSVFTFEQDGNGAKGGGVVGIGGKAFAKPEHEKREKGPWLGIAMEPVQDVVRAQLSLAPGEGVVINHVAPDGPAAKAGIQPNDILVRFEDQIVVEPSQLKKLIAMKKPGESVKLTYLRKGEQKSAGVTLIEHEIEPGDGNARWLNVQPGVFNFTIPGNGKPFDRERMEDQLRQFKEMRPGLEKRLDAFQDQLRQLKEKHPGIVVEKREWFSGSPEQMLKGQIEKLERSLEDSKLPKEQIEKLRKELDHARRETAEAMERAKRGAEEAVKNAQRALEEASRTLKEAGKSAEKEKPEPKKKPGETL